jgi:hypothetical protein
MSADAVEGGNGADPDRWRCRSSRGAVERWSGAAVERRRTPESIRTRGTASCGRGGRYVPTGLPAGSRRKSKSTPCGACVTCCW